MKKLILILSVILMMSCSGKKNDVAPSSAYRDTKCGYHNGKQLYLGPQGGCYYVSSGGNKEYVSRGECSACN